MPVVSLSPRSRILVQTTIDRAESSEEQSFHSASLVTGGAVAPVTERMEKQPLF